jgi:hypothetical protein
MGLFDWLTPSEDGYPTMALYRTGSWGTKSFAVPELKLQDKGTSDAAPFQCGRLGRLLERAWGDLML